MASRVMSSRVLLVDDNQELLESLVSVLQSSARGRDLSIATAGSSQGALALARQHGFDLAVVDVRLPDGSGVDLAAALRALQPLGEVVLLAGNATVDSAIAALRSGAYAFLLKSFRPEELISTVEQALTKVDLVRDRAELEGRYLDLVERTDVVVVGFDRNFQVELFNARACQIAGISRADAIGRDWLSSWIPEADRPKLHAALLRLDETGAAEVETDFVGPKQRRLVRWHLSQGRGPVFAMGIDITERVALERRVQEGEAMSAMGVLAMHLAHEIRNPLNAAVLQLHLMTRQLDKLDVDAAEKRKFAERTGVVEAELGRLNRMLTEFLELARPRDAEREPVAMDRLLGDLLELQREPARAAGIDVRRALDHELLVRGDREKLKQVFLNLVINAFEAMRGGGHLLLSGCEEAGRARFDIVDSGVGIDETLADQVFEPFYTTKEGGTGLGLSIVRKIVDQHGGTLRLAPEPAGGTRVTVWLPLAEPRS